MTIDMLMCSVCPRGSSQHPREVCMPGGKVHICTTSVYNQDCFQAFYIHMIPKEPVGHTND